MALRDDVIATIKHPAIVQARQSIGQAGREGPTSFLVDGHSLVSQAVAAGAPVERLFFLAPVEGAKHRALLEDAQTRGIECHRVSKGIFFRLLGLGYETSVRVLAVVRRKTSPETTQPTGPGTCVLVGERIQDPRNIGVLIRTADAYGTSHAVFSAGSADPFCRASVRSTTGSIFRVPLTIAEDVAGCLGRLAESGMKIVGTSAQAARLCWEEDLSGPCAIVLGNETAGLSDGAKALCDALVSIPMSGGAHSFNVTVAAGIVFYERARQRQEKL